MFGYRYNHTGIPTSKIRKNMVHIKHLKIYASDHETNPFRFQWMKYEYGCKVPDIVKRKTHIAFEVKDLNKALKGKKVIIRPNSPSHGIKVAFIQILGFPIELMEYNKKR